tara:strand:+ start:80 stop:340 length:261 start_codon:yes stop_codon:yes gene_type:complete
MEKGPKANLVSVEDVHEQILDFAGKLLMDDVDPKLVCSCLIAVALRSYMTIMSKEEVLMLLDHIIDDIDMVKPYDISNAFPSTEVH